MKGKTENTNLRAILLTGAALLVASAALAQTVRQNYVPGTDFSKYRTYKWVVIESTIHPNKIVDGEIKQAVDTALSTKGLTKATGDTADLFVGYQVAVDQEKQWSAMGGGIGFRGMGTATSSTINIGQLGVDMYDSPTKNLIWRGTASDAISQSSNPQKNLERLQKAVDKLLKQFPPKSKT